MNDKEKTVANLLSMFEYDIKHILDHIEQMSRTLETLKKREKEVNVSSGTAK